jgi:CopG family nickel-responsive transcriptional regulator
MHQRSYTSRSEAMRDMLRRELGERDLQQDGDQPCVAVLSYVFDHHERQLSSRLTSLQHDHHQLAVATMHAHISHADCVETVLLRGRVAEVTAFAHSVIAETGVRHGMVQLIPVAEPPAPTWRRVK